jgi:hypothetical protein
MERFFGGRAFLDFTLWTVLVSAVFAPSMGAQQHQTIFPAQVPERILTVKTISLWVFRPNGPWQERMQIQAEGEAFLRKWKRYEFIEDRDVEDSAQSGKLPDLIAIVTVDPVAWRPSRGRSFLADLFDGLQAFGAAQPAQTNCSGTETAISEGQHSSVSLDCQTYIPPVAQEPTAQGVWPSYVYGGSIVLVDGPEFIFWSTIRQLDPSANPLLLVVLADDHGSAPLLTAAKRLRKAIETAERARKP